jgi:formylglycine-generating enzyme required for sulfatase activity
MNAYGAAAAALLLSVCAFARTVPSPEMIDLPGGTFRMGSDSGGEDEKPLREVTVGPFAIGRYEVTVAEFAAFAEAVNLKQDGGCRYYAGDQRLSDPARTFSNIGHAQTARHPVVCVSYDEAVRYAAWLSKQASARYRLPTEAEWEYAARAGTLDEAQWSDPALACLYANVSDRSREAAVKAGRFENNTNIPNAFSAFPCVDGAIATAAVGGRIANAFGLYDMLGNAWEMTSGCFEFEKDAAGAATVKCLRQAARGGSWLLSPPFIRYANRGSIQHDHRNFTIGFRLVRELQ